MPEERDASAVAELLELALDEPARALARAEEILASTPDPWWASVARHARGLALREHGEMGPALAELRAGVRFATASYDEDRVADVRATLGVTLVSAGRTRDGLAQLQHAAQGAKDPLLAAKVLTRRGVSLSWLLGRHAEGLVDLQRALEGFREAGDPAWEARTRNILGGLHLAVGEVFSAEAEILRARELFLSLGYEAEAVMAQHNLGEVAFMKGDLPTALATYDQALERYLALGLDTSPLARDLATAYLAAGLARDAADVVEGELARGVSVPARRAELRLTLATALLASGLPEESSAQARAALEEFRRTGRAWAAAHAQLVLLRAREQVGRLDRRLVERARMTAEVLERERSEAAATAWLVAGRLARRLDPEAAPGLLARAASFRHHRSALVRAAGWLARALESDLAGDRAGVARACRAGLEALDAHRATLGSSELRALAAGHGDELARLALATAVSGPPRSLLWWSERWRATSLAQPPVRPGAEDDVAPALAALRDTARRLAEARRDDRDTTVLADERTHWEREVQRRLRRTHGRRGAAATFDVAALVGAVGDAAFVEYVEVGHDLHALLVHGGRVRRVRVGSTAEALQAVDFALYALRRAALGRAAPVEEAGRRLQAALLAGLADRLAGASSVVLSPTSRLLATPWALTPLLAPMSHAVAPSAALWLRARGQEPTSARRAFVCGPGLTTAGAEVELVSGRHPDATVLRDGSATVEKSLLTLDGALVAHIAAHGHFRVDSPLFSALDLDDGPLTVHDLERLDRPPHRVILSACESGVLAPVGAGELLGLVAALLSLGTAGVAASVVPVNDRASGEVMVDLHAGLDRGDDLAGALLRTRAAAYGDPVREATAASFLALGV